MSGFGLNFRPAVRRGVAFTPASLNLTGWWDARDYSDTAFPAAPSWASRASAGVSGTRNILRKSSATRNPIVSSVGGKIAVRFQGVTLADHAATLVVDSSAPSTALNQSQLFSTSGGSFSMVLAMPAGGTDSVSADWSTNPVPFGWVHSGTYASNLSRTASGYRVLTTLNAAPYYYATPVATSGSGLVLVQGQITESTRALKIRVGKGTWQAATIPTDGGLTMVKAVPFLWGGIVSDPTWGPAPDLHTSEFMTTPDLWSDATFDAIADLAAVSWGVTL